MAEPVNVKPATIATNVRPMSISAGEKPCAVSTAIIYSIDRLIIDQQRRILPKPGKDKKDFPPSREFASKPL